MLKPSTIRRKLIVSVPRPDLSWVYVSTLSPVPGGAERSSVQLLLRDFGSAGVIYDVGGSGKREWLGVPVHPFNRALPKCQEIWLESSVLGDPYLTQYLSVATLSIRGLLHLFPLLDNVKNKGASGVVDLKEIQPYPKSKGWLKLAKRLVTNSSYMEGVLELYFGRKAEIIPTIIPKVEAPKGRLVLFPDSRPWKHAGLLSRLPSDLPDMTFRVVDRGGVPDLPNLQPIAPTESLFDVYNGVGLVLCPSQVPEGYGRVAKEALESGRLVLASPAGALPEVLPAHCIISLEDYPSWLQRVGSAFSGSQISLVQPLPPPSSLPKPVVKPEPYPILEQKSLSHGFIRVAPEGISFDPARKAFLPVNIFDLNLAPSSFGEVSVDDYWSFKDRPALHRKVLGILKPGGKLTLRDWYKRPQEHESLLATLASLGLEALPSVDQDRKEFLCSTEKKVLPLGSKKSILTVCPSDCVGVRSSASNMESVLSGDIKLFILEGTPAEFPVKQAEQYCMVILEGWKDCYPGYINALRGKTRVGIRFHSSFGQSEIGAPVELEYLHNLLGRVKEDKALVLLHPARAEANSLRLLGFNAVHFPNLVDLSRYPSPKPKPEIFWSDLSCPLYPRKNILAQLVACSLAKTKLICHSAGVSRFESMYRGLAERLSLKCDYTGFCDWAEYLKLISRSSLGLQVSFAESFSYVTADHFAMSTPCLVSGQVPVFHESSPDQEMIKRLYLPNSNDVLGISDRIKWFMLNPKAVQDIGQKCNTLLQGYNQRWVSYMRDILGDIRSGGDRWLQS